MMQAELDARVSIYVPLLHLHGAEDGCISYDMSKGQDRYFKAEFHSEPMSGLGHAFICKILSASLRRSWTSSVLRHSASHER